NDFGSGAERDHAWARTDNINNLNTPLINAAVNASSQLPPIPTNGTTINGTTTLDVSEANLLSHTSLNGTYALLDPGDSVSWNFFIMTPGQYNIGFDAAGGGTLSAFVDGNPIASFPSADALIRARTNITLTRGLHSLLVRNVSP